MLFIIKHPHETAAHCVDITILQSYLIQMQLISPRHISRVLKLKFPTFKNCTYAVLASTFSIFVWGPIFKKSYDEFTIINSLLRTSECMVSTRGRVSTRRNVWSKIWREKIFQMWYVHIRYRRVDQSTTWL